MGAPVVLFSNVSAYRINELVAACDHMPYKVWSRPDPKEPDAFQVVCDKSQGREASGDAGGARPMPQAHAALRRPGSNPGRSTGSVISLAKFFKG